MALISKPQTIVELLRLPEYLVESLHAAVKMVPAVVDWKIIFSAVQHKLSAADSIAVTSDERSEISRAVEESFQRVVTQNYIAEIASSIRDVDSGDDAAIIDDLHFHGLIVRQGE